MAHHRIHRESDLVESGLSCPDCGGSDPLALYDDGHTFCFSCEKTRYPKMKQLPMINPESVGLTKKSGKKQPLIDPSEGEIVKLEARKISAATCRKFNYFIYDRYQVACYYDGDFNLVAQQTRDVHKDFDIRGDMKKATLFGQQLWKEGGKRLVITEGQIDCMTIAQVFNLRWPIVSIKHGWQAAYKDLTKELSWLESFDEIVFAFDGDDQGKACVEKCVTLFTPGKVKVVTYPAGFKDANEMLLKGKRDEIAPMIFNAKEYRPDGIVSAKDMRQDILNFFHGGGVKSYTLPWTQKFNEMTDGVRKREVMTLTAGTGIGKSTTAHEISDHLIKKHGLTVGIVALEESIRQTILRYLSIDLNRRLHRKLDITEEELNGAMDRVLESDKIHMYNHWGSMEGDTLLERMKFQVLHLNCDFIIFDHISIAVSGSELGVDERRMIDYICTNLRSMVEQTGAGCILICHLSKAKGKEFEEGAKISLGDIRGSKAITQISDTVLALERDMQAEDDEDVAQWRVLKCRHTGETGPAGHTKYNVETGRMSEWIEGQTVFTEQGEESPF